MCRPRHNMWYACHIRWGLSQWRQYLLHQLEKHLAFNYHIERSLAHIWSFYGLRTWDFVASNDPWQTWERWRRWRRSDKSWQAQGTRMLNRFEQMLGRAWLCRPLRRCSRWLLHGLNLSIVGRQALIDHVRVDDRSYIRPDQIRSSTVFNILGRYPPPRNIPNLRGLWRKMGRLIYSRGRRRAKSSQILTPKSTNVCRDKANWSIDSGHDHIPMCGNLCWAGPRETNIRKWCPVRNIQLGELLTADILYNWDHTKAICLWIQLPNWFHQHLR